MAKQSAKRDEAKGDAATRTGRGRISEPETIRDDSSKKFNDTVVMIVPKNEK